MTDDENERVGVTLRGQDAEWFQELKDRVTERRGGYEPGNAELMRMMMTEFDPDASLRL